MAFTINLAYHMKAVWRKSAYSLMSRETTSANSIITSVVNSDAHIQTPLIAKCDGMLFVQG